MSDKKNTENSDIKTMTFEEALSELENLVRKLESGGQTLDSSIEDYTRGTDLRKHCESKLQEAKLKVEKIIANSDGSLSTKEFETN